MTPITLTAVFNFLGILEPEELTGLANFDLFSLNASFPLACNLEATSQSNTAERTDPKMPNIEH
jgi:hypothetical protein